MEKSKKKLAIPHVYVLLLAIIAIFAVLSYIVPAGSYEMTKQGDREIIDAATFSYEESSPISLMQFLTAVPRGLQESAQIIFLVFIVGGAFAVLQETKAIEAGVGRLAKRLKEKAILLVPSMMVLFSIASAAFGMAEECMIFVPIFISIMVAAGYDSITGMAIVLVSQGIGFAGAFANPFTVQVSQGIAELPILSAIWFRVIILITLLIIGITYVLRYALKIRKEPQLSPVFEIDKQRDDVIDLEELPELGGRQKASLVVFAAFLIVLIIGTLKLGWWLDEICGLFVGMAICVAIVSRMGFNRFAVVFGNGMADIAVGALVVGFARGILVVMSDANILNTILHSASIALSHLPAAISAAGMYVFQCLLNFIVPSGSGQAAMSMPILAPLGDMVGVTRQTACIAFQIGDGLSNVFTPTAGSLIAGLALAKVPWEKWAKWLFPLLLIEYFAGLVFVIVAQVIQLGPF